MKFTSDTAGYITGIRFYKGAGNTGTHIGHIWTSAGKLLASATFINETASGWQQANFAQPVQVAAKTVYVASYWDPKGHYSVNSGYFTTAFNNAPLHAPVNNGSAGSNGLYIYGSDAFPTEGNLASNFWVDVVFATTTGSTTTTSETGTTSSTAAAGSLWSNSVTPATTSSSDATPNELGVKFTSDVTGTISGIRFYKGSGNTGTHVGHLWTSSGQLLATVTFSNETASGWQQANFSQPVSISANTVYVASYWAPSGHYAVAQNFFGSEYNNAPLHALADGTSGPNGVYLYNASGFPTDSYASSNYYVDVVFSPAQSTVQTDSLWSSSATPATADFSADTDAYELGVRFTSDLSGSVTGIRFYKGSGNTGTHVGHLWTNTGTLLATATFTNETASGWQQVNFSQPVSISANTVYVASYTDPFGNYALNRPYFTSEYNNAPLHALADGAAGANGTFFNGSTGFPKSGYESSNYWVDVVFVPQSGSTIGNNGNSSSVTISSVSPASGPISGGTLITISGSGFAAGATVTFGGANASSVNVVSSTQLTAVTPAGSAGPVSVTVTDSDPGTASLGSAFNYVANPTVTQVSPTSGPTTGGTTVTIKGTGFQSGAMVVFGAMLAASVTVTSSSQIQAVTPAASAATVGITVTNPDAGKASLGSAFTFVTPTQATTTSSSGALLTGMTSSNYKMPSGWTLVDVNGFENTSTHGLNPGESFYGGSNAESQSCSFGHTGKCSIDTYVTHSYGGVGIVLAGTAIKSREIYVSFWQYAQQANPGYGLTYTDWYFLRRYNPSGTGKIMPDWQRPSGCYGGCNPAQLSFFTAGISGVLPEWSLYGPTEDELLGQWVQWEVHIKGNDPGQDNGDYELYRNGELMQQANSSLTSSRCPSAGCGDLNGSTDITQWNLGIGGDWGAITSSGGNESMAACTNGPLNSKPTQACPGNGNIPYFHIYIDDIIVLKK